MDNDDLNVRVKRKNVKEIFAKESVFEAPSIELCTVFQILQKFDSLVWEKRPTIANTV